MLTLPVFQVLQPLVPTPPRCDCCGSVGVCPDSNLRARAQVDEHRLHPESLGRSRDDGVVFRFLSCSTHASPVCSTNASPLFRLSSYLCSSIFFQDPSPNPSSRARLRSPHRRSPMTASPTAPFGLKYLIAFWRHVQLSCVGFAMFLHNSSTAYCTHDLSKLMQLNVPTASTLF